MKKIISLLLLAMLTVTLFACENTEPREVSCEEIIDAYRDAGYSISYHNYDDSAIIILTNAAI